MPDKANYRDKANPEDEANRQNRSSVPDPAARKRARRVELLAWLMDDCIRIPGTDMRIGLDGLIGMLPGVGDAAGLVVSGFVIASAAKMGAPKSVLFKMAGNIALDSLVGVVPFLGDFFDFAWKANRRNAVLLNEYLEKPRETEESGRRFLILVVLALIAFVLVTGLLTVGLLKLVMAAVA